MMVPAARRLCSSLLVLCVCAFTYGRVLQVQYKTSPPASQTISQATRAVTTGDWIGVELAHPLYLPVQVTSAPEPQTPQHYTWAPLQIALPAYVAGSVLTPRAPPAL